MSVIRAFIAVDLTEELHLKLEEFSNSLNEQLEQMPIRWVPARNIHLTLKFLGDVSEKNVAMITEILHAEASNHKAFEISIGGFGVFPNSSRPRVLWVGIEAPDELQNLQRRIEAEAARLGYAPDQREFSPHLTLGRVSRNATPQEVRQISEVLRKQKLGFLGAARITDIHLFRSDLKPGGAVYTNLYSAPLNAE